MPTNWTNPGSNHTTGHTATITPVAGELMVAFWAPTTTVTAYSGATITDTGLGGGWNQIAFLSGFGGGTTAVVAWWRLATPADAGGITITFAGTGGSGPIAQESCGVERYAAGLNTILGTDISGTASGSGTSSTFHAAAGSTNASDTDEMAWAVLGTNLGNGGMNTWTFAGTSPAANMATVTNGVEVGTQFLGGVQASATAASNTWATSWSTFRNFGLIGATFHYTGGPGQVLIV